MAALWHGYGSGRSVACPGGRRGLTAEGEGRGMLGGRTRGECRRPDRPCRLWPLLVDERSRQAIEVTGRYADGLAGSEELRAAHRRVCDEVPANLQAMYQGVEWLAYDRVNVLTCLISGDR